MANTDQDQPHSSRCFYQGSEYPIKGTTAEGAEFPHQKITFSHFPSFDCKAYSIHRIHRAYTEYQPKLNEHYALFLYFNSSLKILILKIYKIQPPVPIFLRFYIGFYTSVDIVFHNFLKLSSTLSEKNKIKILSRNFFF